MEFYAIKFIMENKVKKILKIGAAWCGPCKLLKKELEDFDLLPIESIDADENEELCLKYNIRSVPVLVFLGENDKELGRHVGFITKKDLTDLINGFNE